MEEISVLRGVRDGISWGLYTSLWVISGIVGILGCFWWLT